MLFPRKEHSYLPIRTTCLQWPLSPVPNVAVVESFDCVLVFVIAAYFNFIISFFIFRPNVCTHRIPIGIFRKCRKIPGKRRLQCRYVNYIPKPPEWWLPGSLRVCDCFSFIAQDRTALFDRISVLSRIYPSGRKSRMPKRYDHIGTVRLSWDESRCTIEKGRNIE